MIGGLVLISCLALCQAKTYTLKPGFHFRALERPTDWVGDVLPPMSPDTHLLVGVNSSMVANEALSVGSLVTTGPGYERSSAGLFSAFLSDLHNTTIEAHDTLLIMTSYSHIFTSSAEIINSTLRLDSSTLVASDGSNGPPAVSSVLFRDSVLIGGTTLSVGELYLENSNFFSGPELHIDSPAHVGTGVLTLAEEVTFSGATVDGKGSIRNTGALTFDGVLSSFASPSPPLITNVPTGGSVTILNYAGIPVFRILNMENAVLSSNCGVGAIIFALKNTKVQYTDTSTTQCEKMTLRATSMIMDNVTFDNLGTLMVDNLSVSSGSTVEATVMVSVNGTFVGDEIVVSAPVVRLGGTYLNTSLAVVGSLEFSCDAPFDAPLGLITAGHVTLPAGCDEPVRISELLPSTAGKSRISFSAQLTVTEATVVLSGSLNPLNWDIEAPHGTRWKYENKMLTLEPFVTGSPTTHPPTVTPTEPPGPNLYLVVGIPVGAVLFILAIIVTVLVTRRCIKRKEYAKLGDNVN